MATQKPPAQLAYQQVQRETAKLLRPLGFKRKGAIIFVKTDDNFGVIHFQSSPYSTKDELMFTVNVAVIIGKLVDPRAYRQCLNHPSHMHGQIRRRIGQLLGGDDKWWTITEDAEIHESSKDFAQLILKKAVPFIQHYMKLENVLSDWEHGERGNLTEIELARYLPKLRELLGRAIAD